MFLLTKEVQVADIRVFVWCMNSVKGKSLDRRGLDRIRAVIRAHWKSSAFSFLPCFMSYLLLDPALFLRCYSLVGYQATRHHQQISEILSNTIYSEGQDISLPAPLLNLPVLHTLPNDL